MDAKALKKRDALFAARLARHDESVLEAIDQAYAPALRVLLRQGRGKNFGDEDIEEILNDVLKTVWETYDPESGAAVRTFYFNVARARRIDRLRQTGRYRAALEKVKSAIGEATLCGDQTPDVVLERIESGQIAVRIRALIDDAVESLTPRQRLAFTRRFASENSESWAKELAAERGMSAQYWRKASDEARQKVKKFLISNGVTYSEKGGHYEVAESRNSA
jgi:RNA polymerase sigma factor (sigma-70 family)